MARKRIKDLTLDTNPAGADVIPIDGSSTRKASLSTLPVSTPVQTAIDARVPNTRAINPGTGLSGGGDLSSDLTIELANVADKRILANITGGAAAPSATTLSALIDNIVGNAQGSILVRKSGGWDKLDPGTSGRFLQTAGAGSDPAWVAVPGGGDVLSSQNLSDLANKETAVNNLLYTRSGGTQRTVTSKLNDSVALKDYGAVGNGATNDTTAVQAANTANTVVRTQAGAYNTTLGFYDLLSSRFTGDGQLILGSYKQARDRSFLTVDPGDPPSEERTQIFDAIPNSMQGASYHYVGAAVGSTPPVATYRNLTYAAKRIDIYDFTGGQNTDDGRPDLGRTGAHQYIDHIFHGGQGDLTNQQLYAQVYSARPGATHFLANPAVAHSNGAFEASGAATGAFLNHSEFHYNDNGLAVAVIDRTRNFNRTNAGNGLGQVWLGDRLQSVGTQPIDAFYSVFGPARRGLDFTPATFNTDKAAILLQGNDRIYGNAVAGADSEGFKLCATSVGAPYLTWNTGASAWDFVAGNNTPTIRLTAAASAANFVVFQASASGAPPTISTNGGDLAFFPATGIMQFGTHTSSADFAANGYVTMKDSTGAIIRLLAFKV